MFSSHHRRPYFTGRKQSSLLNTNNDNNNNSVKQKQPGIKTWLLAFVLGFVIIIVLKTNGDDDAKTVLRRDNESDVWQEIHPDLQEKNAMHRELHSRFHPFAKMISKKQWIVQGKHGDGYAHMAMATVLANGTVLCAFQTSKEGEGKEDQHIAFAFGERKEEDKIVFGKVIRAPVQGPGSSEFGVVWSPVLHTCAETGRTFLFYSQSTKNCRAPGGDVKMIVLDPETQKWSMPEMILPYSKGNINKVIANTLTVTRDQKTWILPFWRERGRCDNTEVSPSAGVLISKDKGKTWKAHGSITLPNTWLIEQTVVELTSKAGSGVGSERGVNEGDHSSEDSNNNSANNNNNNNRLAMFCRTAAGHVFRIDSTDLGNTWEHKAKPVFALPNPNAKVTMRTFGPSGRYRMDGGGKNWIVAVMNDHKELPQPYRRSRSKLRIIVSHDNGKSWTRLASIEEGIKPGLRHHYPTIIPLPKFAYSGRESRGQDIVDEESEIEYEALVVYSTFMMKGFDSKGVTEGIRAVIVRMRLPD
jgi:predicted neuraminidase